MNRNTVLSASALLLAAGGAMVAVAGPLSPPAGPVAPSFKTLSEVEPRIAINATNTPGDANSLFKITQRGSYYLTGDAAGVPGKYTIQIAADNVTLDLNGFALTGGSMGVYVSAPVNTTRGNVTIRNGSISDCGAGADATQVTGPVIEGLNVRACVTGIHAGPFALVARCSVDHCNTGISTQNGARIRECQSNHNTASGMEVRDGGTVEDSTVSFNGFRGIDAWSEVTVRNCCVMDNAENGIDALEGCVVGSCSVRANVNDGVHVGADSVVVGCTIDGHGYNGIKIVSGRVADCTVSASPNGIYAIGTLGTRIEGNTLNNTTVGIQCSAAGCFVVRNNGRGNTVFIGQGGAGNTIGPTIGATGVITSTNPWANFYQ